MPAAASAEMRLLSSICVVSTSEGAWVRRRFAWRVGRKSGDGDETKCFDSGPSASCLLPARLARPADSWQVQSSTVPVPKLTMLQPSTLSADIPY
jgi:hypothetical protein